MASNYESGEGTKVQVLLVGGYLGTGTLAGSLIRINEKITPEKIRKSNAK